jgi:hemolysin III
LRKAATRIYDPDEFAIDKIIHIFGLVASGFGIFVLIRTALHRLQPAEWWPIVVYSACLLTMFACSAAYNLARHSSQGDLLRRLDHAAIFLMIAGTYTPFTARALHGGWAIAMTGLVWSLALAGAFMELRYSRQLKRVDIALYLALGWIILVAWKPLLAPIDTVTVVLIVVGGVLYTIGCCFHAWQALRFHNAIWHGFVLVAASCHYAAVLRTVY